MTSSREQRPAVLIAGPTASGKSAAALALAELIGGVVVNADSMQVYRDLRILTARPTPAEEARVPHRLYGHVDAAENWSAGRWVADAAATLADLAASGRAPVFAGGTGLYFRALAEGLSAMPPVPGDVRARVRAEAEGRPSRDLHADLARRDPASAARIGPGDRQRILRALEVMAATGQSLAVWQDGPRRPVLYAGRIVRLYLVPDRKALVARIDRRFEAMMATGAIEEARMLMARRLDPALPAMRAHGVPGLLAYLRGDMTLDAAIAKGQADTRAYAKRQMTWFRHQMPGWRAVEPDAAVDAAMAELRQLGV